MFDSFRFLCRPPIAAFVGVIRNSRSLVVLRPDRLFTSTHHHRRRNGAPIKLFLGSPAQTRRRRGQTLCHCIRDWQRLFCNSLPRLPRGACFRGLVPSPVAPAHQILKQVTNAAVAIKTVSRAILTPKLVENLESEISILKQLKHRHITELLDIVVRFL